MCKQYTWGEWNKTGWLLGCRACWGAGRRAGAQRPFPHCCVGSTARVSVVHSGVQAGTCSSVHVLQDLHNVLCTGLLRLSR